MEIEENLCKLCFQHNKNSFKIFGHIGVSLNCREILEKYFSLELSNSENETVCQKCWNCVENFHELYMCVQKNYQNRQADAVTAVHFIDMESISCTPYIKEEPINSDDNLLDRCPKTVVTESKEELKVLPNKVEHFISSEGENGNDCGISTDEEAADDADLEYGRVKEENGSKKISPRMLKRRMNVEKIEENRIRDNEILKKYVNMFCDLCNEPFPTFTEIVRHFKKEHKKAGYVVCCEKKYHKLKEALAHCYWHENPDAFNCLQCTKTFQHSYGLNFHMNSVHATEEERKYKCDLCPRSFVLNGHLTSHKKRIHYKSKDKKFECDICQKKFLLFNHLKYHIQRVHQQAEATICEICSKYFKFVKSYEMHYMSEHSNISRKVQCEICGNWLKHEDSLKEHMRRHTAPSVKCQYCGIEKANMKILRTHIYCHHSNKSYPCTACGKIFRRSRSLKEHLVLHTGKNYYKCSLCGKDFPTRGRYYTHKKNDHPIEHAQNLRCRPNSVKNVLDLNIMEPLVPTIME